MYFNQELMYVYTRANVRLYKS